MAKTTLTRREFDENAGAARKATAHGPVLITDRGQPSHVLLSYQEYRKLAKVEPNIADLLYMPEAADIEFEPPKLNLKLKIPDLS